MAIKGNARTKDIPVVMLTAHAMSEHEVEACQAGCDAYVTKPIDIIDFMDTVKGYLGETPEERGTRNSERGRRSNRHEPRHIER